MSEVSSASVVSGSGVNSPDVRLEYSCRLPLLVMFISGGVWLLIASALGLIDSIKFHQPNFLADCAWMTYGRVHAAASAAMVYGFALQVGLGVALWLLAHLGRTLLAERLFITLGASVWNLGVTIGVLQILAGNGTGFERLEMPLHAAVLVFLGYLFMGLWAVVTFHRRDERSLFVSQWFIFAALFWFPWIYTTANLMLLVFPSTGVLQAVLAWWYADNLTVVWLGLVGIAAVFYFVPKMTNRQLHSHYLALFIFWVLLLFASWGGIPGTAPLPAWMPTVSTIATAFLVLPILAVGQNVYKTLGRVVFFSSDSSPLSFVLVGVASFIIGGLMRIFAVVVDPHQALNLSWFRPAYEQLHLYGFFAMVMFGAIYYILPHLTQTTFPFARWVRVHFWLATLGLLLCVVPWAIAGVVQAGQMQDASIPFINIVKSTLAFLRIETLGEFMLLLGHLLFLANMVGIVNRFYRARALVAYADMTADLFKAEGARS